MNFRAHVGPTPTEAGTTLPADLDTFSAFVHLPATLDAAAYRAEWQRGEVPDETPYGFHHARDEGVRITFSAGAAPSRSIVHAMMRMGRALSGLDLLHAWRNRAHIEAADIVWTMLEGEALAILLLFRLRLLRRKPLIASTIWLLDRWSRLGPIKRAIFAWLLEDASVVTVHSRPSFDRLRDALPGVDGRLMCFGIAEDAFPPFLERRPNDGDPIHIVAIGHDRTRDWQTLLDAFGNDRRFRISIVCRWIDRETLRTYRNLAIPDPKSMDDFRRYYALADYVAVPMSPNMFSGITVAMEAAASGAPILSSRTGGVPTYFAEDEALFVPAGDAPAMRDRVLAQSAADRAAMAMRARRRFVCDEYSTRGMMRRYRALSAEILRREVLPSPGEV